ncbi:MAG: DUF455 domain-containing protein [Hyphomicrobiales bacterium]|nr:MAG: DUF455 domain-containing protein [Hyphomicrobiales bacterium]
MTGDKPQTLAAAAAGVVSARDPLKKARLADEAAEAWFSRRLARHRASVDPAMPDEPGRPDQPELRAPRDMPRRSFGDKGRIALLHAIAHIELNAIDLAFDIVGRFAAEPMPRSFYDDWVQVGREEAYHYRLVAGRLEALGSFYGALPAHAGLWQAAQETGHALLARVAVIPLVFEARGLDITPALIDSAVKAGDEETAAVLRIIYRDEKGHVACGAKWFRFLCDREGAIPEPTFQELVRRHFRGALKPPFNDRARSEAGLTPGFYRPLSSQNS